MAAACAARALCAGDRTPAPARVGAYCYAIPTSPPPVPVVVARATDLWIALDEQTHRFPVAARASMGRAVTDNAIALMDALVRAAYAPARSVECTAALREANSRLALLRLLVEGAAKRRHLALDHRDRDFERMGEIGRMLGGWLRKSTEPAR